MVTATKDKTETAKVYMLDPIEILADDRRNARWDAEGAGTHDEQAIGKLVTSYEKHGQLQPVTVRKGEGGKPELVIGYRRHAAALRYNDLHPESPMKLAAVRAEMTDEEAFLKNWEENSERENLSPVDIAINQKRLREEFGWDDVRIAKERKVTRSYVTQLKRILTLAPDTLKRIHSKVDPLALDAALALTELSPEEQAEVIAKVPEEKPEPKAKKHESNGEARKKGDKKPKEKKGRKSSAKVKAAVREKHIDNGAKKKGKGGKEKVPKLALTLKDVKDYFKGHLDLVGQDEKGIKALSELFLEFCGGGIKEAVMTRRLKAVLKGEYGE